MIAALVILAVTNVASLALVGVLVREQSRERFQWTAAIFSRTAIEFSAAVKGPEPKIPAKARQVPQAPAGEPELITGRI